MDLTVNNRILAAIEIRPVQLGRLLGAYELVVPFSGTVMPRVTAVQLGQNTLEVGGVAAGANFLDGARPGRRHAGLDSRRCNRADARRAGRPWCARRSAPARAGLALQAPIARSCPAGWRTPAGYATLATGQLLALPGPDSRQLDQSSLS